MRYLAPFQVDWSLTGMGGHVYGLSMNRHEVSRKLAVACGDGTIRLARLRHRVEAGQKPQDSTLIWQVRASASVDALRIQRMTVLRIACCRQSTDPKIGLIEVM